MNGSQRVYVEELDLNNQDRCQSAWECYQAGFAGDPWNEWKKCSGCEASYGSHIGDLAICPACDDKLLPYWPLDEIAADIRGSLDLQLSYCAVALVGERVVGLVLGYVLPTETLSRQLGLNVGVAEEQVAYQDEVLVHPDMQGHGIGRLLYDQWKEWVDVRGVGCVVARTLSEPPSVVFGWYQRIGYEVTACYPGEDKRVILSLDLKGR